MSIKEKLIEEIGQTPDEVLGEVLHFVRFLKSRELSDHGATAIASETALEKDWLRPEEDEAWRDL